VGPARSALRGSLWHPQVRALAAGNGLFGRFAYLALTQGVVVVVGLAYWAMTARLIPAQSVGLAAAAVSTATFLSAIGGLGIGSLLLAELRGVADEERRVVISSGVVVVAICSGLLALATLSLSPFLGHNLSTIGRQPLDAALLVVGTVCTGVASLLDSTAIGMRRSRVQLVRNVCASTLRLGIVFAAVAIGVRNTEGMLIGWTLALGISFAIWPWLLRMPRHDAISWSRRWDVIRRYWTMALRHHVLNLAITSVTFLLPVLAAVLLVARQYAYFSVAQLVSSTALLLPALLTMSLFAEATGDATLLRRSIRRTFPVGVACCVTVLVVVEPTAPWVLSVFGHAYAAQGATTLRLLLLGGLAYVVKDHYVGIRRAQRRLTQAAAAVAIGTAAEFAAATVGAALYGVRGLCAFWVVAAFCEAAFFLPVVWKLVRRDPETDAAVRFATPSGGLSLDTGWRTFTPLAGSELLIPDQPMALNSDLAAATPSASGSQIVPTEATPPCE
jgi:O-antigen/teichoic acid export membrane protein